MAKNETLLDLLLEVQSLDRVPRAGYILRGIPDAESVSEHSWHLAFLVWILADSEPTVDASRAIPMALLHDVAEVRFGDIPRTAARYLGEGVKGQAESRAMKEILAPLGDRSQELFDEYRRGESPEARFVKACDKLQLMIKISAYEGWGAKGLDEFWNNAGDRPGEEFDSVAKVFAGLLERRG
ncbi:MAG: HD domain-containing protein [Acidobacteriota bacterium]